MTTLENKTALVTGASRGIGRATALRLRRPEPMSWPIMAGRRRKRSPSLPRSERRVDVQMHISADLATPQGAACWLSRFAQSLAIVLDVAVLNAGVSKAARIADYTMEDFDNLFATNVRGPFFLVQQLLPMLGEGSNIAVISSLGARIGCGQTRFR